MADVSVSNQGSIILLTPQTPAAKEWVEENLSLESWQWFGKSFGVEPQYVEGILKGMMEDGLDVEGAAKMAAVPLPAPTAPATTAPQVPGAAPTSPTAQQPQRVGESVEVAEPQQKERHTVVPELPNALFHMASSGEKASVMSIGVLARKKASGEVLQAPSFDAANAVAIKDFKKYRNKVVTAIEILASPEEWTGETEPQNTEVFHLDEPVRVRVLNTPVRALINWVGMEHLLPYWKVAPVGKVPEELRGYKTFWIYGQGYSVPKADQAPMTYEEASEHIDDAPDFSEGDKLRLRGLGVQAKLARGGWHRVSKSTVQSDDKRFTITEVDPTRRKNWFMLKDLETGLSYNLPTMTAAKGKAKELKVDDAAEVAVESVEEAKPVVARLTNSLLASSSPLVKCPDCEFFVEGLWRTGNCDECYGGKSVSGGSCKNCGGTGVPRCCRCEGTGIDPYVEEGFDPDDILQPSDVEKRGGKIYRKNTSNDIQYNR